MRKWLDRLVNLYEFFIAYLFLKGAWDIGHANAVLPDIEQLAPLTGRPAIIIYAAMCLVLGVGLIVSKVFKQRRTHSYVLMAMYLIAFYIVCLSLAVNGWDDGMIFSIFITLSLAAVYLYWKYKVISNKVDNKIEAE